MAAAELDHPPILNTRRLVLRSWRREDRAPFASMNADAEVMRYFPAALTVAESDALADRIEATFARYGFGLWAVERSRDGAFLGFTGLNPMPEWSPGAGEWEIGWRLRRDAWGQGYATEAAIAVRDAAFGRLGLPRLWSLTAVVNEPSQRVMRRIGMGEHSRHDHPGLAEGHALRPHVIYRLSA